ncbi:2-aminoethylphosphonate ABC transporter substrate-binding protein [Anaerococcus prevotii]|uniref:Extracellular solute-binding protein family 1 n=1 Tax=Anaerococcus prevotii (strain ATCC 9321 / DSM 20548 / JCM 6508 / NCTC 11806 / PC1) TaxID=525919 RepID=C7RF45_ANAPD|nr:ABC transporter substrate-binding protein [Anaerococcus prevotii]ACV28106.1 extracellular solute-binding protein family 1 [Anaerococcus prevotii DSM 20548]SUU93655.1 2-aminoethylphosphonate ABC transporter substrate-binding protein [Anaerococcus prevotii]
MKKITRLLMAIVMIFTLSACGNADNKTEEVNEDQKTETKVEEKNDDKEVEDKNEGVGEAEIDLPDFEGRSLNVVATSDSYVPLFDRFSELTGAKVEFLSMSSGEVITRTKAEGKPMADLWFGGGLDAFMAAKEDGLLDSYKSEMTDKVPERFRDEEGYYTSKGLTVVGFIVNDQILEEKGLEAPKTWKDLAKEEYKGEIIMSNPAISGTNYAALKGLLDLYGEEEGWALFEKINENIDFYSKRGKDPQEKTAQGEFAIGIIPVDKKAFDAARDNGLSVVYPEDGVSWVPEGVAVFKDSENADVAKAFEDFMLTKEAQKMIAEIDGKDTNQLIVEGAEGFDLDLPKDKLVDEDLSTFGTKRDEILNKFKEIAKDKAREE